MLLAITRVFSSRGRTLRRGSWWEQLMNVAAGSIFAHTSVRSDHGYHSLAKDVLVQIPMTRTVLLQNTLQGQRQVALLSLYTWSGIIFSEVAHLHGPGSLEGCYRVPGFSSFPSG
jgi:hypothetical protein